MKRLILLLLGFTPFLFGRLLDLMLYVQPIFSLFWISIAMLFIWFLYAYFFSRFGKNTVETVINKF